MLRSVSISGKLGFAFGSVLAAAALTMGFVYTEAVQVERISEANERLDREQALSASAEKSILMAISDVRGYRLSHEARDLAALQANLKRFDDTVQQLQAMLHDPADLALLKQSVDAAAGWRDAEVAPILASASSTDLAAADALRQDGGDADALAELVQGAEKLRGEKYAQVQQGLRKMDAASHEENVAVGIGALAILAVTALFWVALRRLLARPVVGMTGVMRDLAGGNNQVDVPDTERGDEIGAMAKAVLVFRDAAIAKEAAERAKAVADAEQQLVVDTLADRLGKLAEGDLTATIREPFPSGYAAVRANFNAALAALRALIGAVLQSSEAIRTGAGEVAEASEHLAKRTESNAASLEESAAAIGLMDSRLGKTASDASDTAASAGEARTAVEGGRSRTDGAVQAMGRVSESAKGIDTVIEGLDKIAFQTRVLAMNAAVEAGRAGEAGRGFAVVADLVSSLAMRAEEEAKQARTQLTAAQLEIQAAVGAVQAVDQALAGIEDGVGQVHTLVGGMATDNKAQASAIREISSAVTTMDQSTQQTAAMVEETSAAARSLFAEVNALVEQASRFRVDEARTVAQPRHRTSQAARPSPAAWAAA